MGKLINPQDRPHTARAKSRRRTRTILTAEQLKNYELLRRHIAERIDAVEHMSEQEKAQADAEWELFKNSMNEERARVGARLLYVD